MSTIPPPISSAEEEEEEALLCMGCEEVEAEAPAGCCDPSAATVLLHVVAVPEAFGGRVQPHDEF